MKKCSRVYVLVIILLITLFSCHNSESVNNTDTSEKHTGLATLSVINLRKEPAHASELVSQVILGTPLLILKTENSWLQVQTPDNYTGWTEKVSVELMDSQEMETWKKSTRVIFLDNTGWLYDSATVKAGIVGDLVGGDILEKTGESNGYVRLLLPDGRYGFVETQKVMDFTSWEKNTKCTEENICKTAMTFLGLPYLWGGTSAKAVDCSGFVQSVFFRNGLILTRDASMQALHGIPVDISDGFTRLRKGDLLFFGSKANGVLHVTHAALYLGNSEYINSAGRVLINSLDSTKSNYNGYRFNSLLEAKRIIGTVNDPGIVPVNKHPWY